jgi:hypothetical protein
MREAGKKQLIIGLVIAGVGLAISLGSYISAASSSGGGSYFLLWGLVIVGLIRAFRGFSMMRAAGSAPSETTQGAAPVAPAPPAIPAMPPQPPAQPAAAQPIETHAQEPSTAASPPAPSSSMWD